MSSSSAYAPSSSSSYTPSTSSSVYAPQNTVCRRRVRCHCAPRARRAEHGLGGRVGRGVARPGTQRRYVFLTMGQCCIVYFVTCPAFTFLSSFIVSSLPSLPSLHCPAIVRLNVSVVHLLPSNSRRPLPRVPPPHLPRVLLLALACRVLISSSIHVPRLFYSSPRARAVLLPFSSRLVRASLRALRSPPLHATLIVILLLPILPHPSFLILASFYCPLRSPYHTHCRSPLYIHASSSSSPSLTWRFLLTPSFSFSFHPFPSFPHLRPCVILSILSLSFSSSPALAPTRPSVSHDLPLTEADPWTRHPRRGHGHPSTGGAFPCCSPSRSRTDPNADGRIEGLPPTSHASSVAYPALARHMSSHQRTRGYVPGAWGSALPPPHRPSRRLCQTARARASLE
ncbi:hypothetical protein B0H10DRAFT_474657 [Mycena sp. CBHHK59/15]|nr:hypothetical protein B0H10DRAFT_474657 [Mycena sp. CBHHK59/15]